MVAAMGAVLVVGAYLVAVSHTAPPPVHMLEWVDEGAWRWAPLPEPYNGRPGFIKMDNNRLGIAFRNELAQDQIVHNRNLLNGSGVALGDVTGNGFVDIYLARLDGPNRLYENLGGWRFRDITDRAGVALPGQFSTGAVFADLNGNGHLDLVVTANDAPARLFLNDGAGRFTEREGALDTGRAHGSTSVALADITGNGALDLYIVNYKERSVRDIWPYEQEFRYIVERLDDEYRIQERYRDHYRLTMRDSILIWFEEGEPDLLFLNEGDARFTQVPLTSGVFLDEEGNPVTEPMRDWGLHARFHDLTGNGLPDLYVANDFESPDRIWLNRGDGTFQAAPRLAFRKSSLSSMAVDFSDVNRNGLVDIFVVEMLSREHEKRLRQMSTMAPSPQPIGAIENRPQYLGNTLFLNRGDGTWAEVSEWAGVRRSDWSWSTLFVDLDLDGFEDLIVATGHRFDVQDSDANQHIRNLMAMGRLDMDRIMLAYPRLAEPNAAFRNLGNGRFEDVTGSWGLAEHDISHGMALADLDNSGTLDLVVNRLGDDVAVYRNSAGAPRVQVRLAGEPPNTSGIGAKIRFTGGPVSQTKEAATGASYLSGSDPAYVFAAGEGPGPFSIEVTWRSGRRSVVEGVRTGRVYEIRESGAAEAAAPAADPGVIEAPSAFFQDVSERLGHAHHENPFPDFARQPLLPYRLSRLGPGVAWFDVSGDGLDDLFVGTGAGGRPAWFRNQGDGSFRQQEAAPFFRDLAPRDLTTLLGWRGPDGTPRLLAGISSYETSEPGAEAVLHLDLAAPGAAPLAEVEGWGASVGALAMADYTGNGHLDLFVGGRVVPGQYPRAAASRLLSNEGDGRFVPDLENTARLREVGLVTGAVFSDLDGDGTPELILAREWGSLAVFKTRDGALADVTAAWGLDGYSGWWTGVTTGDLNGNGRLDIVAANWGTNHPWAAAVAPHRPVRIRYGDLNGSGTLELIETYHAERSGLEVPRRGFSVLWREMPFLETRVRSFEAYATSSLEEILGGRLPETSMVEAHHLEHTIFWNTEAGFRPEPLPEKAQWAPAFHVAVADLSGDGNEDIFLSQNFFSYQLETPRSDAGRGLWLRGDGTGGFQAVPGHRSGILVWGEQRGAALADFDGDGRVDLVVTQNGGATRLFRNQEAVPGLRVRLRGPEGNPQGIGAQLRLRFGEGPGPVREIRAGSGYWSQGSAIQVLGMPEVPLELHVRWPHGPELRYPLPAEAREVVAGIEGGLQVTRTAPPTGGT